MKKSLESLQATGVAMLPYTPELQQTVQRAAALWEDFYNLPLHEKQQLPANDAGAGTGYEYKLGDGPNGDHKENFDVAVAHQSYLEDLLHQPLNATQRIFVQATLELSRAIAPLTMTFAQQAEDQFNMPGFTKNVEASYDSIFVRFIHYFGDRTIGDLFAEPHTDQSGFTFHLYETTNGCERLDYDSRQWIDMPVATDKTAVIPAMQLQYESGGQLRALTHRVVATETSHHVGRSAIVCFIRLANTPVYDKARNGRLQEKQPGFNYDQTPEQFSSLFETPTAS